MTGTFSPSMSGQIERGISILREGGLIAYPTDTVYGLGASVAVPEAVKRVYEVKKRPLDMPLPLLLSDVSQIPGVAGVISGTAWLLVRAFLPGALTLVLAKNASVPDILTGGGGTVAVRIPAHPVPVALIRGVGVPIIGTSANLSGGPSPLTAGEVNAQLGDSIDMVIDGGECPGGKESTIVDMTGEKPAILRQGAIPAEEIERVCGVLA